MKSFILSLFKFESGSSLDSEKQTSGLASVPKIFAGQTSAKIVSSVKF